MCTCELLLKSGVSFVIVAQAAGSGVRKHFCVTPNACCYGKLEGILRVGLCRDRGMGYFAPAFYSVTFGR